MAELSHLSWPFFGPEHLEFSKKLHAWAEANVPALISGSDEFDSCKSLVKSLGEAGWLKHCVPSDGGGVSAKLDVRTLCLARETLGQYSALADFAFAMQGLGSGPISLFGSAEQKERFLPAVSRGESISAFALSEKEAGSDVSALATTAEKDGDSYVLNGEKTWISNAGIADIYTVFVRTGEAPGAKGLSAFVVGADTAGFEVVEQIETVSPHPLGTIRFSDCRVPETQLIGTTGKGLGVALGTLDVFRSTVGAAALGFSRRALNEATKRSSDRKVFGQSLSEFQITKQKLANMAVKVDASALLIYRAAWTKDSGAERITKEAAMAKLYATESAQEVIDSAVQLFGGSGVVSGNVVEELYRDIRPLRIYEGTSEIQKLIIADCLLREA